MNIGILQPTPFRKGHYFIYTYSLQKELKNLCLNSDIISSSKIYKYPLIEKKSFTDWNLYSFKGAIFYLFFCYSSCFTAFLNRNKYKKFIILDCEYVCISLFLCLLKLVNWRGEITLQINAPNFNTFSNSKIKSLFKIIQKYFLINSLSISRANVSCLGVWHKKQLSKQLNLELNRIWVIEDGGGEDVIYEEFDINNHLKLNGINFPETNKKIFLLFGNFREDKGYLFITEAWKKYFDKEGDPVLWIVGHDEENLIEYFQKLNAKNILISKGYVKLNLIKYIYKKADFAILPYLKTYKGGSGPLMKGAFTHKRCALVSQVAEMGRLASEEKLAFSFRGEDELSLANSVQDIQNLEDSSIQVIIDNAHKYTKKRDWKYVAKRFIESLERKF